MVVDIQLVSEEYVTVSPAETPLPKQVAKPNPEDARKDGTATAGSANPANEIRAVTVHPPIYFLTYL